MNGRSYVYSPAVTYRTGGWTCTNLGSGIALQRLKFNRFVVSPLLLDTRQQEQLKDSKWWGRVVLHAFTPEKLLTF